MSISCCYAYGITRRAFVANCGGAAVLAAAGLGVSGAGASQLPEPAPLLPTIQLGEHSVTRLLAGYNPIGGWSHSTLDMSRAMLEYFTAERTAEFLLRCEAAGINTWQYDRTDKTAEAIRLAREAGCAMKLVCLHADPSTLDVVMTEQPIAIAHHGGVTDSLFREGKAGVVHDFVKRVHDHGVLAGVSAHSPANIRRMADEGWENDFFMACFYYLTRPREEVTSKLGTAPVGELFLESDPDDMAAVVRAVDKPCLVFKILAAGQLCWSPASVEAAFQAAFARIKPTDAVIVGMFPRYADQIAEDASYARKYA